MFRQIYHTNNKSSLLQMTKNQDIEEFKDKAKVSGLQGQGQNFLRPRPKPRSRFFVLDLWHQSSLHYTRSTAM